MSLTIFKPMMFASFGFCRYQGLRRGRDFLRTSCSPQLEYASPTLLSHQHLESLSTLSNGISEIVIPRLMISELRGLSLLLCLCRLVMRQSGDGWAVLVVETVNCARTHTRRKLQAASRLSTSHSIATDLHSGVCCSLRSMQRRACRCRSHCMLEGQLCVSIPL